MKTRNLMPPYRTLRRRVRTALRWWMLAGALYALLLAGTYAACWARFRNPNPDLAGQIQAASAAIAQSRKACDVQQRILTAGLIEQAANRSVGNQPDWSVLLTALSEELGDEIVFRGCRLECPLSPNGAVASPQAAQIQLSGLGRSQTAVSKFVLRLEESGLLDKVKLVRTSRESLGDASAVAFVVDCGLSAQGGKK